MRVHLLMYVLGALLIVVASSKSQPINATATEFRGQVIERTEFVGSYSGQTFNYEVYCDEQQQDVNKYYLDEHGSVLTPNEISAIEAQAFFQHYGVFDPRLADTLHEHKPNESFDVLVWYKSNPDDDGMGIISTLSALVRPLQPFRKYPSAPLIGAILTK